MKFTSKRSIRVSLLQSFSVLLALSISLQAQQPTATNASQDQGQMLRARVFSGKFFQPNTGNATRSSNAITITPELGGMLGSQVFSLSLPADADPGTLKATLNGHDVSDRFRGSSGSVSAQDGLSTVKNILNVTVKTSSGSMASGRWRSMSAPPSRNSASALASKTGVTPKAAGIALSRTTVPGAVVPAAVDPVCDPVAMCPAWLPPSVSFTTVAQGNWSGATPWLLVNGVPSNGVSSAPAAGYVLAVYNRQTLAPEDFEWFNGSSGAVVTSYITGKNYTSNDLVIVGTAVGVSNVDQGLNTSSIGGSNLADTPSGSLPASYMVIGFGGQAPHTAYENYGPVDAYATGSLMEDANGNYNFQSSDIIEYAIEPQDPGNFNNPSLRMNVPANLAVEGESQLMFYPNALAGQNGIWMLVLDRENPMPPFNKAAGCIDYEFTNSTRTMSGCGTFYSVGAGNSNIDSEWSALATALNAVPSSKLVFLQSIGSVGTKSLAQTVENEGILPQNFQGFQQFETAFEAFGGTPYAIAGPTFTNQDTYAFVGYKSGGNPLTGNSAEASSAIPGQLGVLHGTLQRNSNGYYQPAQSSAEQQGLFNDKGGLNDSDYTLAIASYQQPVEWPSNSGTALLPGASSIAGQQAAYRFISHWLLAAYYMRGIQGPHQDDIHFFFTGSTNTFINYQAMDPANLQFPTVGTWSGFGCTASDGTTCTFQALGDSAPTSFTTSDFTAVKSQLSTEVVYLTNTLQYLVTGSTNMKDIVASGSANVGLALSAAANTVLGSGMANLNSQEIANKKVTFSWQSLLSTLGSIASVAARIESFGEANSLFNATQGIWKTIKAITADASAVGSMISTVGDGAKIIANSTTLSSSPQPFTALTTTVGQLATQDLQSPLISGFDTTTDNITADWGRLSTIGPRVVNVNDSVFFAPNQVVQVAAINALTTAATRSFYFSLLPTVYNLHYWKGVAWAAQSSNNGFQPTMGSIQEHEEYDSCNAFYLTPNTLGGGLGTLSSYQGIVNPSVGNVAENFAQDPGYLDFWVVDGVVSKAGSQNVNIAVMGSDLAENLFSQNQLNVPMAQFFTANGPMSSVVKDASADNYTGWSTGNICDASDTTWTDNSSGGLTAPPPPGGTRTLTTTTLVSPMSGVLGHDMVFTAKVMAGNQPATKGVVYISIDGTVLGNPSVAADGTASFTVPGGLALGNHPVQADYAPGTGYEGSTAQPSTFIVYSESADINLVMTSTSVNVSYSAPSTPLALQISSIAGLAGNVVLSCSGLPAGLACSFNSTSLNLTANGNVSTSLQIIPSPVSLANAPKPTRTPDTNASLAILILPLLGLGCLRNRSSLARLMLLFFAAGVMAMTITGCSGGSTSPTPIKETGTKTIMVNARVGSVSRSVGVDINIQ
jgi:hypothetical protein